MKKLFFILCIFLTGYTYSQTDSLSVKETQTERIIDKYSDKIIDGFNKVIDEVTPLAEEGFNMVVRLQIAKGIIFSLPIIFFFFFLYIFIKEYNKIDKDENKKDPKYGPFYEANITAPLIIYLILTIITFVLSSVFTYDALTHLIAPEWYAIKEIIDLF